MPKIAIDISPLNDGNSVRGVGYYTKNLVTALQQEIKTNPEYKNLQIDLVKNIDDLQSKSYDLIHYPYFDPFFLTLPNKKNIPQIITIHDLIPRQFKKQFPVGLKGEIKWLIQKQKARQSDYIITVSHYSKFVISDLLNYPVDHIYVTYEAADTSFSPDISTTQLSTIRKKYNLPDKFVLYLGDINWNKNIRTLVNACETLKYPLIIVGSSATKIVDQNPWNQDIHWLQQKDTSLRAKRGNLLSLLGFVPDSDLPTIFNLATIYCQPSFAEGFGLPVVQAMQAGLPVVYSQETSLPEVMDYSGLFFDPSDQKDLELKLSSIWSDKQLQQELSQKGLSRSKFFTWQ